MSKSYAGTVSGQGGCAAGSTVSDQCLKCGQKVSWIVMGINLGIFLIKGGVALVSNSRSLMVDSFESLANFIITIIVLVSFKIAEKGSDEKHPYGYGKVEFLASAVVNLFLFLGALIFIFISLKEILVAGPESVPSFLAVGAALISIIANQIAFEYGRCVGEKLQSPAILANAWVNRADIITSLAVIVAVVGANLGLPAMDHVIAILIALFIVKIAIEGMLKSGRGLMDYSPDLESEKIREILGKIDGIPGITDLKTRLVGRKIWVDLEIMVSGSAILSEGLKIKQKVKDVLMRQMSNIADVSVRVVSTGKDS